MKKVIGIILIIVISLVILTGCTSQSSAVTEERFVLIDNLGNYNGNIYYDKETKVQYMLYSSYRTGACVTVLVDAEGKPLLYQGE